MKKDRFSLSRLFRSVLERGTATNFELDTCNELSRSLSPNWKSKRGDPSGFLVPSSAFSFDSPLAQRDVTTGGAAGMIAKRVRQMEAVIGWSACVQNGAAVIGPFASSNIQIWQDTNLPPVTWQPETGAVVPSADPTLTAIVLSPKRIAAQALVSRQLIVQATGSEPFDQFLASRLKIACSSVLDQAALYGATNGPAGIIETTGCTNVTTASPITWPDFVALRLAATNIDVDRSSFGYILSPHGRSTAEATAKFSGGALSIWDTIGGESAVSRQVNDGRVFCGVFAMMAIATWGAGSEGDFAVDLVIDPYTQAVSQKVAITISMFCDVGIRWPAAFAYTAAGVS